MAEVNVFHTDVPFEFVSGESIPQLDIAYTTFGKLNANNDNVIWVFHALTGNAELDDWWSGLFGSGNILDPDNYFIVCANMIGSCYGSSGPASLNPITNKPYQKDFPLVTVTDMVRAHQILARHLGVESIYLGIGGSMGGQQLLEWAVTEPDRFQYLVPMATNARHSAWGIAFNESQRMAIEAALSSNDQEISSRGLETARSIAMLSYRSYQTYEATQSDDELTEKLEAYRASSYQRYQGSKLSQRFDTFCYLALSKAMDSHNLGRGRGGTRKALNQISGKTLVIAISSDVLFPPAEQKYIADHIPGAIHREINSIYGHDGFLVEFATIRGMVAAFLEQKHVPVHTKNRTAPKVIYRPGDEPF